MSDALFLHGAALSAQIGEVTRGAHARCAVAYWGDGAFDTLFADRADATTAQVVCDLTGGSTNPAEIERLIERGLEVKAAPKLHAKLYLSEQGAVIGSANASRNALTRTDPEPLEAGVFVSPGTAAYEEAGRHFKTLWAGAADVTLEALEAARAAWRMAGRARALAHPKAIAGGRLTLHENLLHRPEVFDGVDVVITKEDNPAEELEALSQAFEANTCETIDHSKYDNFLSWDVEHWPQHFISIHRMEDGSPRVTMGRPIFCLPKGGRRFDHLTVFLRSRDPELAFLAPFIELGHGNRKIWNDGFEDFLFDAFENRIYTPGEVSRRMNDERP